MPARSTIVVFGVMVCHCASVQLAGLLLACICSTYAQSAASRRRPDSRDQGSAKMNSSRLDDACLQHLATDPPLQS
jgi:hypothetical protein